MSPLDIAYTYGFTRQYWDLLIASRKIPYYTNSGGKFTLNIYAEKHLADKYGPEYVTIVKRTISRIRALTRKRRNNEKLFCPKCDSKSMHFIFNRKTAKAKCKFCKYRIRLIL